MGLGAALFELLMGPERNGTGSAGLGGMANVCGAGLGWAARYLCSYFTGHGAWGDHTYLNVHWADNGNLRGWDIRY